MNENLLERGGLRIAGFAALVAVTFANGVSTGLVLDNELIIGGDPRLRGAAWENLRLVFTEDYWYPRGAGGLYRPLTTLSYLVNHAVLGNGPAPAGYHVVNGVLHLAVVLLVHALLRRVSSGWAASAGAALFAVHPVVVESVTNIVGRADLLAACAVLGGLLLYVRAMDAGGRARIAGLVGAGLVTAAGLLCKENAIVVVALVPLWDLAFHYRATDRGLAHDLLAPLRTRTVFGWAAIVPPVVAILWIRSALIAGWALPPAAVVDNPMRAADLLTRELTAFKVIGRSLGLMLYPARLSCDYSFDQIPLASWSDGEALVGIAIVAAALGATCWAIAHGRRAVGFLVGFVLVTMLPTSNLLVIVDSMMAERFLYLPLVGVAGLVAIGVEAAVRQWKLRSAIVAVLVLVLAARTMARNRDWETNVTLWTSAVEAAPRSFRTHRSLAWARFTADERLERGGDEIIAGLERAIAILEPLPIADRDLFSYLYLGIVARVAGDRAGDRALHEKSLAALEAARAIDRAINERRRVRETALGRAGGRDRGHPWVYRALGETLTRLDRPDEAIDAYRYHAHLAPQDPLALRRIAEVELARGRRDAAAVVLVQLLLGGHGGPELADPLMAAYAGVDCGAVPASRRIAGGVELNETCPAVQAHVCAAAAALERDGVAAGVPRWIDRAREIRKVRPCGRADPGSS